MNILTHAQIKRRGMAAIEDALRHGPVYLVEGNRTVAVVISVSEYSRLTEPVALRGAGARKPTSVELFMREDDTPGGLDAKGLAARIEEARGGRNER